MQTFCIEKKKFRYIISFCYKVNIHHYTTIICKNYAKQPCYKYK